MNNGNKDKIAPAAFSQSKVFHTRNEWQKRVVKKKKGTSFILGGKKSWVK
jgi:hypothetical protein